MNKKTKKKILLIEDEKVLSDMYTEKFSKANLQVVSTMTAEDGLVLAKETKPDLIVLDILLLKENGIFFLKKLREMPEISSLPVVVFSNYDNPEIKKEAEKFGIIEYLLKTDYTPEQIVIKIKEYLK